MMGTFFLDNPCVRLLVIQKDEKHPCFFCGHLIPVFVTESCPVCSLMICPKCKRCMCSLSKEDQDALKKIHLKYCCDYEQLKNFRGIKGIKASDFLIKYCSVAIKYCSKKANQE